MATVTEGREKTWDPGTPGRPISPRLDLKFIGSSEFAFANGFMFKVLGDPWLAKESVRKFGPFSAQTLPQETPNFNISPSKSISWRKENGSTWSVQISPVHPTGLSIIVPIYNPDLIELEECLTSILHALRFANASDFELLLIDDASSANAAGIRHLVDKLASDYSLSGELQLKTNSTNRGVSQARNRGFLEAKNEWIYFVDADDMVHPWYFSLLHAELLEGADLVSASMLQASGQIFCAADKPLNEILLGNCHGSGIGVRKRFFSNITNRRGLYNAENAIHYEDWELNIFARLARAKIAIVDAPLYYYRDDLQGRNLRNQKFQTYSFLTTPFNALKAAQQAGLEYSGRDVFPYLERLMTDLQAIRYFQVPERPTSRAHLFYRAFLIFDEAISKKMYLSHLLNFFRRKT